MNIGTTALCQRHTIADRPALSHDDESTVTYRELAALRDRYAAGFIAAGVRPGDRVGMLLWNSIDYWAVYLATTMIGAIAVRLNFRLAPAELEYVLTDSGCTTLLVHDGLATGVGDVIARTGVQRTYAVAFDGTATPPWTQPASDLLRDHGVVEPTKLGEHSPAMIMYTSGTTGAAKGAVWTHEGTTWFGLMQVTQWGFHESTVSLTTGPLYHVGSMEDLLLPTLMTGGHAISLRSGNFELEHVLDLIERRRVTDVLLFPAMIYELLSRHLAGSFDLSSLRRIFTGGSPLQPWAVSGLASALPDVALFPVYGLTEGGGISTVLEPAEVAQYPAAAGRPMPFADVRIEAADGRDAAPDEIGEILVSGPNVAREYWNRPDETAATFIDGWCRTGDLGLRSPDGLLFVTGRKKDMIRSGDENVYAAEVEAVIADLDAVRDVAVVGVPDRRYGEVVCAVVARHDGATLSATDVLERCRSLLAGYKRPRHVVFVDDLPRNATNKVLKQPLRDRYAALGDEGT